MENFKILTDLPAKVVRPSGRLDTNTCADLDNILKPLVENERFLILDLSQCNYLSSSGIRVLLKTKKSLLAKQGELFLTGILPEVYHVIELVGMQNHFRFEENPEAACTAIEAIQSRTSGPRQLTSGDRHFTYQPSGKERMPAFIWKGRDIAGYDELSVSVGYGSPAEPGFEDTDQPDLFVTTGNCAAFIPLRAGEPSDFRVTSDPCKAGILLSEAISFGDGPSGLMQLNEIKSLTIDQLADAAGLLKQMLDKECDEVMLLVINDHDTTASVTVALLNDPALKKLVQSGSLHTFLPLVNNQENKLTGATFILAEWQNRNAMHFTRLLNDNLVIENITGVEPPDPDKILKQPMVWVYLSKGAQSAETKRLIIETSENLELEPYQRFLIRRLYTDCAKVKVEALHGGFSAQTFQVASYDDEGRKMRPTVLKMAGRALITRESERCRQYALPYIFNNSAIVLGDEFYGEKGALRYNFVGIGGEESRLKWLTHYFYDSEMDVLSPIFDKVFLQILKPWYGQPVYGAIYPFKDHDPTLTFFPHIYQTVDELFSVSPDEQYIQIDEINRPILNPYWFLKHEFPARRHSPVSYYSGICHGDLNMQNILLDENRNVYLIDFSETKPRSVVSDFARLEDIFLVDNAPLEDEKDLADYIEFIVHFYESPLLFENKEIVYHGRHPEKVAKHAALAMKMREYAFNSVKGDQDPLPYYLALLEWILPVVCYKLPVSHKRLSMIVSGLLSEKVAECIEKIERE
ncbi:MAG: STAS domain-containing protein [Mangrovibacterium sp.]